MWEKSASTATEKLCQTKLCTFSSSRLFRVQSLRCEKKDLDLQSAWVTWSAAGQSIDFRWIHSPTNPTAVMKTTTSTINWGAFLKPRMGFFPASNHHESVTDCRKSQKRESLHLRHQVSLVPRPALCGRWKFGGGDLWCGREKRHYGDVGFFRLNCPLFILLYRQISSPSYRL